ADDRVLELPPAVVPGDRASGDVGDLADLQPGGAAEEGGGGAADHRVTELRPRPVDGVGGVEGDGVAAGPVVDVQGHAQRTAGRSGGQALPGTRSDPVAGGA